MQKGRGAYRLLIFVSTLVLTSSIFANPVVDSVAAGNVSIQQTSNTTVVNQTSQQTIINWQSFNIGQNESVHFQQPAGGVALNRISPTDGPSSIYGRLTATGQIILINPAGIYFGPTAVVNVGGLIASTANISNHDFLNGYYHFQSTNVTGTITNHGQLIAADHGLIALIGGGVENNGTIQANLGHVVLASGDAFTMSFAGNDLINFSVDRAATSNPLPSGVNNTGKLIANGGTVMVAAKTAANVLDKVINMQGVVEAQSVNEHQGEIILSSDPNAGMIYVSANLDASGKLAGQLGGNINITGYNILIDAPTRIDVSGDHGGGNINIGGNAHGIGDLPNANAIVMASNATISADAITSGNGGNVVLWSDHVTKAYGKISAKGGAESGHGGWIETSSHGYLDIAGARVDLTAAHGTTGLWLLDPYNVTISNAATSNGAFDAGNPNIFTPSSTGSNVQIADIAANLASANVQITTAGAGLEAGNITVVDAMTFTATNSLSLIADNNIIINNNINGAFPLILNATNNILVNAAIGNVTPLTSLSFTGATTLNANVSGSTGLHIYNSNVTLGTAVVLNNGTGDLQFDGTLDTAGNTLTLNTTGAILVNSDVIGGGDLNLPSSDSVFFSGSTTVGNIIATTSNAISFIGNLIATSFSADNTVFNVNFQGASTAISGLTTATNTGNIQLGNGGSTLAFDGGLDASTAAAGIAGNITSSGGDIALGDVLLSQNTILTATNGDVTMGGIIGNNHTLTVSNSGTGSAISGVIDSLSNLTKSGTGTLTLSNANTYNGTTTVSNGILSVTNALGLGTTTGGTTVASGATLNINGVSVAGEALSINGTGVGGNGALTGTGVSGYSGTITLLADSTIGGTGTFTIDTVTDGASTFSLTKAGSGTVILGGGTATYDGDTNITAGTLRIAGNLPTTTNITISTGATLDLNGVNATLGSIAGDGDITLGAGILTSNTTASTTFSGTISGAGGIAKAGTGTWTLSGSNNYNGTTAIGLNGGRLLITHQNALGTGNAGITILSGGQLQFNLGGNALANTSTISASGIGPDGSGAIAKLAGSNTDTLNNIIIINLSGTTINSGSITGRLILNGNINLNAIGRITGVGETDVNGVITGTGQITLGGGPAADPGLITLNNANTHTGGTNISINANVLLTNNNALGNASGVNYAAIITGGELDIGNTTITIPNGKTLLVGGNFAGASSIISSGNGTINATGSGSLTFHTGETLQLGGAGNLVVNAPILGDATRNVNKIGAGTLTLNGTNTYGGGTTLSNGNLIAGSAAAFGTGTLTLTTGTSFDINGIAFANAITLNNAGLTLSNNGSLTGAITLTNGTTNTITANGGSSFTIDNTIDGAGDLTIGGTGTVVVNSALGGGTALTSLNVTNANTTINNSVFTTNNQTYANAFALGSALTLSSTSGNITFNNTINNGFDLTVASGGITTFNAAVGAGTALASLSVASSNTIFNTGTVNTTGNQNYDGVVTLTTPTTFTATGTNPGIAFNNGIAGGQNVTLNGSGTSNSSYSFSGNIAANNVTVNGNATTNSSLFVNGSAPQTWTLATPNSGAITGVSGVTGTFSFNDIQSIGNNTSNNNTLILQTAKVNEVIVSAGGVGSVVDPISFNGFTTIYGQSADTIVFPNGALLSYNNGVGQAIINGVTMYFYGFPSSLFSGILNIPISQIMQQPETNAENSTSTTDYDYSNSNSMIVMTPSLQDQFTDPFSKTLITPNCGI